jgi:hypothetical protein
MGDGRMKGALVCAAQRDRVTIRIDGDAGGQIVVGDGNTVTSTSVPAHQAKPAPPQRPYGGKPTRVFVSYVRDDLDVVDRLAAELTAAGFDVWIDHARLAPGMRWKAEIHRAIAAGDFFLACFSPRYWKPESYMNEELLVAVERLRTMPRNRTWFIPVKLAECELPDYPIGPGETIGNALQYADFGADWALAMCQVIAALGASPTR